MTAGLLWRHEWPIEDPEMGWLDLCAEAWVDLVFALADEGLRLAGDPKFTLLGDGARLRADVTVTR